MNYGILGVVEAVLQRIDLYKSNFLSISLHIFTFKRHTDMRVGAFASWYICDVKMTTHVSNVSNANFCEADFQVARSLRTYWELPRFIFLK